VRRPGHALDSTGYQQVTLAGANRVGGRDDRLQPRATETVHRLPRHLHRQSRQKCRHPGNVPVVLTGLVGAAEDHVIDPLRRKATLDQRANGGRRQIIGPEICQRAAGAPDGGAHGGGNKGIRHGASQNE
jgi:hypothetical protein